VEDHIKQCSHPNRLQWKSLKRPEVPEKSVGSGRISLLFAHPDRRKHLNDAGRGVFPENVWPMRTFDKLHLISEKKTCQKRAVEEKIAAITM
jgi:hypothetical protein